jgi:hypothetical protein
VCAEGGGRRRVATLDAQWMGCVVLNAHSARRPSQSAGKRIGGRQQIGRPALAGAAAHAINRT